MQTAIISKNTNYKKAIKGNLKRVKHITEIMNNVDSG